MFSDVHVTGSVVVNSTDRAASQLSGLLTADLGIFITGGYAGGVYDSAGSPTPNTGVPPSPDPLINKPDPVCVNPCTDYTAASYSISQTLYPGHYTKGLTLSGGTFTLMSGTYILDGDLSINGGAVVTVDTGDFPYGVTFFNTKGKLDIGQSNTDVTMSAPTRP